MCKPTDFKVKKEQIDLFSKSSGVQMRNDFKEIIDKAVKIIVENSKTYPKSEPSMKRLQSRLDRIK